MAGLKSLDFIRSGFGLKEAGGEMLRAGHEQLRAGQLMLEAAGARNLPHGPGGEPHGPGKDPGAKAGEPGAKPGEPGAKAPAEPGARPPPAERTGIYSKPPLEEVPKVGGKMFGGGGVKGLAGGLAEGVIGAILYSAGDEFQDYLLGRGDKEKEKFSKVMQYPALHDFLDRLSGRFDDARPADPFLSGDREGIMERARRSAEAFRADPEAQRGRSMMERSADPFLFGDRDVIMDRARRSAEAFQADPEAERGRRMMAHFGPLPPAPEPVAPDVPLPPERPAAPAAAPAPAPAPAPPVDHTLDGVVVGSIAPQVDTSGIEAAAVKAAEAGAGIQTALNITALPQVDGSALDAAHAKATEVGAGIQTALNVTASPQVDVSSIAAALGMAERLHAALSAIGGAAASANAAVAAMGNGGAGMRPAKPGPSLASRATNQFSGVPGPPGQIG